MTVDAGLWNADIVSCLSRSKQMETGNLMLEKQYLSSTRAP